MPNQSILSRTMKSSAYMEQSQVLSNVAPELCI